MKRFVTLVALTCALCISAHAGNIPMTGPAPIEPPQTTSIATTIILTVLSLVR
jgi:hypothetical protein